MTAAIVETEPALFGLGFFVAAGVTSGASGIFVRPSVAVFSVVLVGVPASRAFAPGVARPGIGST